MQIKRNLSYLLAYISIGLGFVGLTSNGWLTFLLPIYAFIFEKVCQYYRKIPIFFTALHVYFLRLTLAGFHPNRFQLLFLYPLFFDFVDLSCDTHGTIIIKDEAANKFPKYT